MRLCCVCFARNERLRYQLTRAKCLGYHGYRAALRTDTTKEAGVDKHSMTISPKEHLCLETSTSQRPAEAPGLAPCTQRWKYDFSCSLTGCAACVQPARTQQAASLCGGFISVVVTVETVKCSLIPQTVLYGVAAQLCCFENLLYFLDEPESGLLAHFTPASPLILSLPFHSVPSAEPSSTCHFLILCPAHSKDPASVRMCAVVHGHTVHEVRDCTKCSSRICAVVSSSSNWYYGSHTLSIPPVLWKYPNTSQHKWLNKAGSVVLCSLPWHPLWVLHHWAFVKIFCVHCIDVDVNLVFH